MGGKGLKLRDADLVGLRRGKQICMSNRLQGRATAAGSVDKCISEKVWLTFKTGILWEIQSPCSFNRKCDGIQQFLKQHGFVIKLIK